MPYSELHIGMPHLELNQLLKCVHHEEPHSSLRFSGLQFSGNGSFYGRTKLENRPSGFLRQRAEPVAHAHVRFYCLNAAIKADET